VRPGGYTRRLTRPSQTDTTIILYCLSLYLMTRFQVGYSRFSQWRSETGNHHYWSPGWAILMADQGMGGGGEGPGPPGPSAIGSGGPSDLESRREYLRRVMHVLTSRG
jgi:hypothetical protein